MSRPTRSLPHILTTLVLLACLPIALLAVCAAKPDSPDINKSDQFSLPCNNYYKNATGKYTVYYNSPLVYREFNIDVDDSLITDAWTQNYTTFGGIISKESFSWDSKQATYRLKYQSLWILSGTAILQATMEGSTLHTYVAWESLNIAGIEVPAFMCSDIFIVLVWLVIALIVWRLIKWIKALPFRDGP